MAAANSNPKVSSASGIVTFVAETKAHGQMDAKSKAVAELSDFLLGYTMQRVIKGQTPDEILTDLAIIFKKDVSFQKKVLEATSSVTELKDAKEAYNSIKIINGSNEEQSGSKKQTVE